MSPATLVARLRRQISPLQPSRPHGALALHPAIDPALGGGLALGALHEAGAEGLDAELAALPAAFAATLAARLPPPAPLLWIARRADLHPPGLLALGLDPGRVIFALAEDDTTLLAGMETALRSGAFAGVIGEAGRLPRLAGRRLHLAALARGTTALLLRRYPHGRQGDTSPSLATTRWRLAPAPSHAPHGEPGTRWRLTLLAARGGTEGEWLAEPTGDPHAPHPLRVVPRLADHAPAQPQRRSA